MRFFAALLLLTSAVFSNKPLVVVSIYPIYDMVSVVAQNEVDLILLAGPGIDPHSFNPKPKDVANISAANLFFYISADFEPWASKFAQRAKSSVSFAAAGELHICNDNNHDHSHAQNSAADPHIWIDPERIPHIIETIRDNLIKLLPKNAEFFNENAQNLIKLFSDLDLRYKEQFATVKRREVFFAGHNSFSYFANRYNLEFIPVMQGFTSSVEPSPKQVATIIDQIRKNGTEYIFYDALESKALAQTIANETGVEILPLYSVHTITQQDFDQRTSFFEFMQRNYENLFRGLQF
ncbi:MAG: metal ABC transporter substrate-binding protein [Chitinivibrionia bacterium]|nr:metal ABC transporter substrate-binding protein [Chitinivibrionia bacterium]